MYNCDSRRFFLKLIGWTPDIFFYVGVMGIGDRKLICQP